MSTRTTTLDERYGRTPSRRRRGRLTTIITGAVVLVAVIAWSIWTGIGGTAAALDESTNGVDIVSAQATVVDWTVSGRTDTKLICAIEATDESDNVVGLTEVVVPVTGSVNRGAVTRVRTVRLASDGLIESCRDA